MEVEFVGGARTVTGSSYILKNDHFTIMVDCGMFQGKEELRERNFLNLIYAPSEIDILLLTHAHIDHSGLVPKLVKEGFRGKIYATKATVDLCTVMLPDSAHIQESDNKLLNQRHQRQGKPTIESLYKVADAEKALEHFVPVNYGDMVNIHPDIKVRFKDAGHILGSAFIEMWVTENGKETKIVFSGDLGPKNQAIIRDPDIVEDADFLFIESTYGDRLHKNKEDTYTEFKEIISSSYNSKGNIVIPAFAIERTQEIIYTLGNLFKDNELPLIPVYIDSPLAINATEIFRKHSDCFSDSFKQQLDAGEMPLEFDNLYFTKSVEESKELNDNAHGAIILSASGMCTAGRIKYHLMNNLYKKESSVIFVGFQAEGTLGRRLVDGEKIVKIHGEDILVNAQIYTLGGFSAHADKNGLLEWIGHFKNPNLKIFVVHGEEDSTLNFVDAVTETFGFKAIAPTWGEIINLDTLESHMASYGTKGEFNEVDKEIDKMRFYLNRFLHQYIEDKEKGNLPDTNIVRTEVIKAREIFARMLDRWEKR